ncbi:MAG: heme exporter protein CcmD [Microbacteriaceae bacterium]|nr:heme exporter protein CcmD [Burkholderiaceae bacterium]
MNWPSFDQFLQMGGYGLYVWGSYGATLALMSAEALLARRRHRVAFHAARIDDGLEATA